MTGTPSVSRTRPVQSPARTIIKNGHTDVYPRGGSYRVTGENVLPNDESQKGTEERAKDLARIVADLPLAERAAVILTGNVALIGIKADSVLLDEKLVKYKAQVEKAVKAKDKQIDHVAVTLSDEMYGRILSLPGAAGATGRQTTDSAAGRIRPDVTTEA